MVRWLVVFGIAAGRRLRGLLRDAAATYRCGFWEVGDFFQEEEEGVEVNAEDDGEGD